MMNAENNIIYNANVSATKTNKSMLIGNGPQYDPRSDLLKAIRDGELFG